jgi:hypothetical protein
MGGTLDFGGNNRVRARWWRESWYPYYDHRQEPRGPTAAFTDAEDRLEFVARYRRLVRKRLQ